MQVKLRSASAHLHKERLMFNYRKGVHFESHVMLRYNYLHYFIRSMFHVNVNRFLSLEIVANLGTYLEKEENIYMLIK